MTTQPTQTIQEIQIDKAVKALDASAKQQQVAVDVLNGLRDELGSLEVIVESLEAKAQAELDARIEIAKAESNKQGVTVNTGK